MKPGFFGRLFGQDRYTDLMDEQGAKCGGPQPSEAPASEQPDYAYGGDQWPQRTQIEILKRQVRSLQEQLEGALDARKWRELRIEADGQRIRADKAERAFADEQARGLEVTLALARLLDRYQEAVVKLADVLAKPKKKSLGDIVRRRTR